MMKRLGSSDSLGALMSICPTSSDEQNQGYPREIQSILEGLDDEGYLEGTGHYPEKKRRLSLPQVKALEKYFEVENKLEPERKVKLAHELGLQPRQVAVWFQNRRARWKTKQLEKDYGVLKASFDSIKHNYDNLKQTNEALLKEVRDLKAKLNGETIENEVLVKEETMTSKHEEANELMDSCTKSNNEDATELNFESFNTKNCQMGMSIFNDFKDGSPISDSSAILNNEENNTSLNAAKSSSLVVQKQIPLLNSNGSSGSASNYDKKDFCLEFSVSSKSILEEAHNAYQPQFVKIEEHNFFNGEDSCSTFFSDDQPPTLHWYTPEVWN